MHSTQNLNIQIFVVGKFLLLSTIVQMGHGISLLGVYGRLRSRSRKLATRIIKTGSVVDKKKIEFVDVEEQNQPTITITINKLYDSHNPQHPSVGIESSISTSITEEEEQRLDVSTDVAELAKEFEQAMNGNNDLNVENLLTACGRLETSMRQIGFTQSADDISGNVRKIQKVYNCLPNEKRSSIASIIRHEFDTGVHGNNSKLQESSATMGFLWLGRSINYQYNMFQHMIDNDDESPYEAAIHAYEKALKPHLSWPLQKVGQTALKRLKPLKMPKHELFCRMGGFQEERYKCPEAIRATQQDVRKVLNSWRPMLHRWKETFSDLELAQI